MSHPDSGDGAPAPVDAPPDQTTTSEFEAVIRGLQPLPTQPWPHAPSGSAVPLAQVLGALVRSVADAQLAADVAAAKAVAAAAEEPRNESSTWAAGVLPSFYQIAEIAVDVSLDLRFAPVGPPDAAVLSALVTSPTGGAGTTKADEAGAAEVSKAGAAEVAGRPVRVVLRQVPPPAAVMAGLPVPHPAETPIHFD
ncbi:MAG TPA: hypothetical protein VFB84_08075 [Micromonosporaceae bacterium]|nr:hypothetical protein [Micromonosporaceae bacterium]